jgi:hypothetical protein
MTRQTMRRPGASRSRSDGAVFSPQQPNGVHGPRPKPTDADIRRAAYEVYLERQRTGAPGTPETDWFEAQRRLRG